MSNKNEIIWKILIGYLFAIFPFLNVILFSPGNGYYESPLSFFSSDNASIFLGADTLRYFHGANNIADIGFGNNVIVEFIGFLAKLSGLGWWLILGINSLILFSTYLMLVSTFNWDVVKKYVFGLFFATPLLIFSTGSLNKEVLLICGITILFIGLKSKSNFQVFFGLFLLICRPIDFLFGLYACLVFGGYKKTTIIINFAVIFSLFLPLNIIFTDEIRSTFIFQAFTFLDQNASKYYNFVFSYSSYPFSIALLVFVNFGINLFSPMISETVRESFSVTRPLLEGVALFFTSLGVSIYFLRSLIFENKEVLLFLFVWVFLHAMYPLNQLRYYIIIFPVIPLISDLFSSRRQQEI
ncbi:hypothetical protein [Janthinobacterium sp. DSP2-3-3]|uniref:hypothetical protein n=1 Tax=Janthinobacterium sp. DSP2-3-3 TaxID=2804596 RepID=UPI003CE95917